MLKEALEYIFSQAKEGANPEPHEVHIGARNKLLVINGEISQVELEKMTLKRRVFSVLSICDLIDACSKTMPQAYVGPHGVTVILDDSDRREIVTLEYSMSPQFKAFLGCEDGLSQRNLVRELRTRLFGCVQNEMILSIVRQIEFGISARAASTKNHQQESMGREVEREVRAAAGDLPEEVRIRMPIWSTPSDFNSEVSFVAAVDVDFDNEKICLRPVGDSLENEIARVRRQLVDAINANTTCEVVTVEGSI